MKFEKPWNCGDVKADGEPGWNGLPNSNWDGSNGVKFMSNAVPGVCMSFPFWLLCPSLPVLIVGMFDR